MGLNGTKCSEGIPFRSEVSRLAELQATLTSLLEKANTPGHETMIDPDDIQKALDDSQDRVIVPTKTVRN